MSDLVGWFEAQKTSLVESTGLLATYVKALEDALDVLDKISMSIDVNDREFHHCFFLFIIHIHVFSYTTPHFNLL